MCIEFLRLAKGLQKSNQFQEPPVEAEFPSPATPGNNTFLLSGQHLLYVWQYYECDEREHRSSVGIAIITVDLIYLQSIMTESYEEGSKER